MIRLDIHEAKTQLSRCLDRLEKGETQSIILFRRNVPIAEIRPLSKEPRRPAPAGRWAGSFAVTEAFFEPLPDELIQAFEGSRQDR